MLVLLFSSWSSSRAAVSYTHLDVYKRQVFSWTGTTYAVSSYARKFAISETYKQETEWLCDTVDELLEYMVGTDRLRDVITQVKVWERTI